MLLEELTKQQFEQIDFQYQQALPKKLDINDTNRKFYLVENISDLELNINQETEVTLFYLASTANDQNPIIKINLNHSEAKINLLIGMIAENNFQQNLILQINHLNQNTASNVIVKNIMKDSSKFNLKGNIYIPQKSQLSQAQLQHDALLLSKTAKSDSTPSLEIIANDVKASHSATVGRLDDELAFYCLTRGLDQKTTQEMLIKSFLEVLFKNAAQQNSELAEKLREYYYSVLSR